ncbi:prostasin-like [Pseudomyrmex gracilis]|uniref:prostasin-like n=1 Tax=Pseudomyrmex gracilis TaxID=219809 RepID=UPI0009958E89|nr:prostasin-like [Pseudomyrmex gracilis]
MRIYTRSVLNSQMVFLQVSNIYFTCNYIDSRGSVGAEIAILQVDRPFEKSAYLIPICIDLFNALPVLKQNSTIKLPAFDRPSATSTSSGMLQALEVSYSSIDQCTSAAQSADIEQYLRSHDKFCARYTNGSFVCDGDSGNGVVVFSDGLWYLRGVVTSSLGLIKEVAVIRCNHNMFTIFTQISSHVSFIHDILSKLERKQQPTCSTGDFT